MKQVTRREFLKLCGGLALVGTLGAEPGHASTNAQMYGYYVDVTKCNGCMECVIACKAWNNLKWEEEEFPRKLSGRVWTVVNEVKKGGAVYYVKRQCMHCVDPSCVAVCPIGARTKHKEGPVVVDIRKCFACKYCMAACPFSVPRLDHELGVVRNCWMCLNRVKEGMAPACVQACLHGALGFGRYEEILDVAKARAQASGGYVYGEEEAGGTCVVYILPSELSPEDVGLPSEERVGTAPLTTFMAEQSRFLNAAQGAMLGFVVLAALVRRMKK